MILAGGQQRNGNLKDGPRWRMRYSRGNNRPRFNVLCSPELIKLQEWVENLRLRTTARQMRSTVVETTGDVASCRVPALVPMIYLIVLYQAFSVENRSTLKINIEASYCRTILKTQTWEIQLDNNSRFFCKSSETLTSLNGKNMESRMCLLICTALIYMTRYF